MHRGIVNIIAEVLVLMNCFLSGLLYHVYRWDLVTINPAQVFGPPLSSRADGESVQLMKGLVNGLMWVGCPKMGMGVVDVRDVAAAHCLAMADANASGRYLIYFVLVDNFPLLDTSIYLFPLEQHELD